MVLIIGIAPLILYSSDIYKSFTWRHRQRPPQSSEDMEYLENEDLQALRDQEVLLAEKDSHSSKKDKNKPDILNVSQKPKTTVAPRTVMPIINADAVRRKASSDFVTTLAATANDRRQIMLAIVDVGYANFAANFVRLNIARLSITNFALLCVDRAAVDAVGRYGANCSLFDVDLRRPSVSRGQNFGGGTGGILKVDDKQGSNSRAASDFGTPEYYRKTNIKTVVMIQALELGYSVLMVDVDVVLFRDPFPYFDNCTDCDVHFQMDRQMYNTGFMYARPTTPSRTLFNSAWNQFVKYQRGHDQTYVNMAIRLIRAQNIALKINELSARMFQCGVYYFEHAHRMFENAPPCGDCVMAHNNYMGSVAAKIYRFRENLLWTIDDDLYYSNRTARYIVYENPLDETQDGSSLMSVEIAALKNALAVAAVTDRILILPKFHCCSCEQTIPCSHPRHKCSLLSMLRVRLFDAYFRERYRENSFLQNSLVPRKIRKSVSPILRILNTTLDSDVTSSTDANVTEGSVALKPASSDGATVAEIRQWLSDYSNVSVVRFHTMYGVLSEREFDSDDKLRVVKSRIAAGFVCSEYEQWEKNAIEFMHADR